MFSNLDKVEDAVIKLSTRSFFSWVLFAPVFYFFGLTLIISVGAISGAREFIEFIKENYDDLHLLFTKERYLDVKRMIEYKMWRSGY